MARDVGGDVEVAENASVAKVQDVAATSITLVYGMTRSPISRLSAAFAVFVFTATGGITGTELSAFSLHGSHRDEVLALELDGHVHHAGLNGMPHHQGHPGHQSGDGCTCLGPCPGGAMPPLRDATPPADRFDFSAVVREQPSATVVVHCDPRSYLHPLPNGPPERA